MFSIPAPPILILHVPLTEGCSVDDDDGVLDEGLGPHQLVVTSVVNNVNDTGLPGDRLASPGEVSLE